MGETVTCYSSLPRLFLNIFPYFPCDSTLPVQKTNEQINNTLIVFTDIEFITYIRKH